MAKAKKKVAQLEVGETVSTEKLKFRAPQRRGSMYDAIYDKLAKLKKGQSFIVPVPKDVPVRTLQNRINAAIRRGPVSAPDGCVFRKNTTVDGQIAVCCLGEGEAFASESRFAKRKEAMKAKKIVAKANAKPKNLAKIIKANKAKAKPVKKAAKKRIPAPSATPAAAIAQN